MSVSKYQREGGDKERGGYDCQFVDSPHEQLQTKCPVCLCVLRDPYISDCCGYSFCYTCITIIQDHKNLCPLCNGQFVIYPDKRLHRTLNSMKVYCVHMKSGCNWQGELGMIDEHLNSNPTPDLKMAGCDYTKTICDYCNVWMDRKCITHHQLEDCEKRPYSCDYCHEYQSSHEDVTVNHWLVCPSRPVSCPNECGIYPERNQLQRHLSNDCEVTITKCPFSYVGCEATVLRKGIQDHLMKDVVTHLSLQSQFYESRFSHIESKLNNYETKIADLEKENAELKSTISSVCYQKVINKNSNGFNMSGQPDMRRECTCVCLELEKLKSLICVAPLQFTIHSVAEFQREKRKWLSPPFYTHAQGYLLCIKVYPSGHSTSAGSDVSVYVCIMKGRYDNLLKWPFRGLVTVQLVDQVHDKNHIVHTVSFQEGMSQEFSGRVTASEMSGGWGILKFASLDGLIPQFLKNDSLQIRVNKVELS